MKRIRNAAMLAAILASFTGASQAQVNPTPRARVQLEDSLTASVQPNLHRMTDKEELGYDRGMDYTQESRLNGRHREVRRDKARAQKEKTRSLL